MFKKTRLIIKLGIIAAVILYAKDWIYNSTANKGIVVPLKDKSYEIGMVQKVVDGDTIEVKCENETRTIRLIGVDTPESVNPDTSKNTPEGKLASTFTKKQLSLGTRIYMTKDVSNKDKYGRYLRYIWLDKPITSKKASKISEKMYNALLVKKGYAYAKAFPPDVKYKKAFAELEKIAKKKKTGILWK